MMIAAQHADWDCTHVQDLKGKHGSMAPRWSRLHNSKSRMGGSACPRPEIKPQCPRLPTSLPQPRPSNISRASPRDLRRPMRTHGNRAQAHVQDIMAAHQLWHHPCRARRNMCSISLMKLSRNYKIMLLPLWHPI